jgi:hypothetical protein
MKDPAKAKCTLTAAVVAMDIGLGDAVSWRPKENAETALRFTLSVPGCMRPLSAPRNLLD